MRKEFYHDLFTIFCGTAAGFFPAQIPNNSEVEAGEFYPVQKLHPQWPSCHKKPQHSRERMSFAIENGIETPRARNGKSDSLPKEIARTLDELQVGQSFMVPALTNPDYARANAAFARGKKRWATKPGVFTSRRYPEGMRIWRLE